MCVYSIIILVSCLFISGVLGPWEFFWRAGSYTFSVCDSAVWSAGPVQFYLALSVGADGGTVQIFFLSGSFVAGTVRLKWWGGGPSFSAFTSLLSVFLAVGCLR